MSAFPKVNFRHYIAPTQSLGTLSIMDGTNKTCTWPMQQIGRIDGADAITKEGWLTGKIREYNGSDDLKRQWPRIGEYVDYLRHLIKDKDAKDVDIKCSISFLEPGPNGEIPDFDEKMIE